MTRTTKRSVDRDEQLRLLEQTRNVSFTQLAEHAGGGPAAGPGDLHPPVPGPLPPLFTSAPDFVNFANVKAGQYDPTSYYAALRGSDTVVLPASQAAADAIGYDATKIFSGNAGDDFIVGGALNDLISGDDANDRLFGNAGDDILAGGNGNDQLFGAAGNDIFYTGNGIDYVDAGAGNDIIVSTENDQLTNQNLEDAPNPLDALHDLARDTIHAGAGNDIVFATNEDTVDGGSGDDIIVLNAETDAVWLGYTSGHNGDDIILGSVGDDWIGTGIDSLLWPHAIWNAANKAAYGGYNDVVVSGDGDDHVNTMIYCNANVDTGKGNDDVFVLGLLDVISMGDGNDELYLFGGACKADLGAGNDYFAMTRAAYDNPNVSEITLGAGADTVHFTTNEWLTNGDQQPQSKAPWVLDFNVDEDLISQIDVTNLDDPTQSLDAANIKVVDIKGGSALIYDDPVDNSADFCFARFAGVDAQTLQAHIDANTAFV